MRFAMLLLAVVGAEAQEGGFMCACETCVSHDNSVSDCESFGIDCGCFQGDGCESCVRKGNTVATCESFGLPCDASGGGGGGYGGACGNILARSNEMNNECCDEPTEDCSSGAPSTCNLGCARVLLPFFTECSSELGNALQEFQGVMALCHDVDPDFPMPPLPPPPPPGPPPPTPVPPPPPHHVMVSPTFQVVTGPCTVSPGGECVRSPNYPNQYAAGQRCEIKVHNSGGIRATAFDTESRYDYLEIAGLSYTGSGGALATTGVPVLDGATITFTADSSNQRPGFEVCGTALNCGDHGRPNDDATGCICDANYFGRAVPAPGQSVCDEGPWPLQYEVIDCSQQTNCGTYTRVDAQCTGTNCDAGNPTTCGSAPLYEKDVGLLPTNPTMRGNPVLYRWVLADGTSTWRVGTGAKADCLGIPSARSHSHASGQIDLVTEYNTWQESTGGGWIDSTITVVPVGGGDGGGH